jgi:hypothetical protein
MTRTSRYSTVNVSTQTLARIDQGRAALAAQRGTFSRAAFLTAAVEHYLDTLADDGYDVDAVGTDQLVDLEGTKIPFRPAADWALVDTSHIPNRVTLATGHGPGRTATFTATAEILPHLTRGRFGGWREMLRSAGYTVDDSRTLPDDQRVLSDGRDIIAITTT